ncbi:BT_3987 domain-containing protein [Saccharicrinis sp. FJH62]|uniref:BT_3987 domain-containing protein n=1 Tax=Saccharicrinis sp. FJH62 TaxID=3344657 RepID=UPI0035D48021
MKNIIKYITVLTGFLGVFLMSSCDELPEEQFVKYVLFARNGFVEHQFEYRSDTLLRKDISVSVSGTSVLNKDLDFTIAVDPDTLKDYNYARYLEDSSLYLQTLPDSCYSFESLSGTVKAGDEYGLIPVNIIGSKVNKFHNYVLPLRIVSASEYTIAPVYSVLMLEVQFVNNYSGTYVFTSSVSGIQRNGNLEFKVVDENTCFFISNYTGDVYNTYPPILVTFNSDNSLTISGRDEDELNIVESDTTLAGETTNYFEEDEKALTRTLTLTFSYYDPVSESTKLFDGVMVMALEEE